MKIIILYESYFGNTMQIAQSMGNSIGKPESVIHIKDATFELLSDSDIIIIGSPTRGFRPCENTTKFLKSIGLKVLKGKKVAAFDTRLSLPDIESKSLRYIVKTGGYAAKKIAKSLQKKGGLLLIPPEGFLVAKEKGPLVEGELERAANWITKIVTK